MNVESLFRRLLYLQVMLGLAALAVAERNPGFFLVAGALALLSWYAVEGPSGKPLGRWVINLGAVAALAMMIVELQWLDVEVLAASGHLMAWLQVLLLYSRKKNQDYVLMLSLSLMQMLCASLLSVSMLYGAVLMAYSVAAVWTASAVALKVAADRVRQATDLAVREPAAAARVAEAGGHLPRQLHHVTAVVAVGVLGVSVAVFVISPRYERFGAADTWGRLMARPSIGFNEEIRLGGPPPSPDNQQAVMTVSFMQDGLALGGSGQWWRLRGASLDEYDPVERRWSRGNGVSSQDSAVTLMGERWLVEMPLRAAQVQANITLRSPPQGRMFTLFPPVLVATKSPQRIRFSALDQEMAVLAWRQQPLNYSVLAPVTASAEPELRYVAMAPSGVSRGAGSRRWDPETYAKGWQVQPQRLRNLVQQILERTGEEGLDPATASADQVAAALTNFLRSNYTYSLASPPPVAQQDPILSFLFVQREGHCELFAAALAALARAQGLRARVVTGYYVGEYNPIGGYYVVRESDAHAWCEIECGGIWRTFDPSPPGGVSQEHRPPEGVLQRIRHLYEYLDFGWVRSVASYDEQRRRLVMAHVAASWTAVLEDTRAWVRAAWSWLRTQGGAPLMGLLAAGLAAAGLVLAGVHLGGRWLLGFRWRRRLRLDTLPRRSAWRLARELRFYLALLATLQRHGYRRAPWQSPGAFARQLALREPQRMAPVTALTELFYEMRFGGKALDAARREQARKWLADLSRNLVRGPQAQTPRTK